MKKTVSILAVIILLLGVLPTNFAQATQAEEGDPGYYNVGDIAVINRMIDNNGLKLPKAPADGSSVPDNWVVVNWSYDSTDMRITDLFMGNHGLTGSLDLRGLDCLEWMYCQENRLTALDVSNTGVSYLYCEQNQLTTLDVSKNSYLVELCCEGNRLTTLNVRSNSLMRLYCHSNQLTTLDVSGSTNLEYLDCRYNNLPSMDALIGWQSVPNFAFYPQGIPPVPVTSVKLNALSKTLTAGDTTTLSATVSPANATNKAVTWKSSNTAIATVDSNGKVTAKSPGKATITVTTVDGNKTATCAITVKPKAPTSPKAAVVSATSVKISWGKVAGATGYQVRRSTSKNGTYKAVKTTTGTSFTNTKLKAGQTYYYKVRAYKTIDGQKIYGAYSSIVSVTPKPLKVTGVKAVKAASDQAKISWNKQANVSGYQIVRATSRNGTYYNVASTSKLTYTNKNLNAGKTYYYKVRAYKTVDGRKVYGAYSGVKSVKV